MCLGSHWQLVNENTECKGTKITPKYSNGKYNDIETCAQECRNASTTMFQFQQSKHCDNNGLCQCYCEKDAELDGTCKEKSKDHFNLYRLTGIYCLFGYM